MASDTPWRRGITWRRRPGCRCWRPAGNAIDAGVAAGIATGVLEGAHVSFGAVAPILIWLADRGEAVTISGLGCWPAKAGAGYFQRRPSGKIPIGIERTVVPAAPDAWIIALEPYGTMSFVEVAEPAIPIARRILAFTMRMADYWRTGSRFVSGRGRAAGARPFRSLTALTCGPWCQGPMLSQELHLLDPAALARYGHNTRDYIHGIVEAIKLAAPIAKPISATRVLSRCRWRPC